VMENWDREQDQHTHPGLVYRIDRLESTVSRMLAWMIRTEGNRPVPGEMAELLNRLNEFAK